MKKYLMTALTAVALSGLFTGCSKEMETNGETTAEADIIQTYENAFITRFGQPHENQTWGFGSVAGTRAVFSNRYAGTRGVFSNGNEWAANDRDDLRWKVPPALTSDQKDIVRIYFQNVPNQKYEDPHWTNYFIQQVYKGGDNPGLNSTEKYKAADNQTDIVGSDHMDHLAAIEGESVDHIRNFNHGTCETYPNVLDYKGTLATVEETYPVNDATHRHPDEINLMTNSTTASFGYYNSNSSVRRTKYTGLVSWQTIKTWADANGYAGKADCLNDGWNRSFMGFDFEMMIGPELYAKNDDGSIKYLTYGDLPDSQYAWDGVSTYGGQRPAASDFVTDSEGNKIPVLNSSTNMYAGTNGDIDQNQLITSHSCLTSYQYNQETQQNDIPYYQNQNCLNTKVLFDKVDAGYCLVDGSKGCKWVKIGGTADGYYSDWIVTLTEAQKYDTPNPPDNPPYTPPTGFVCRIIAEDLTVGENSDFDFNDVVFDVFSDGKILVRACGGTLPLTVAGREVHGLFGQSTSTMINTGWNGTIDYVNTYREINYGGSIPDVATAYTIPVVVTKGGLQITLTAKRAKVASKIAVGSDYLWCAEREDIDSKYHKADGTKLFQQYVIGKLGDDWNAGTAWYQQK